MSIGVDLAKISRFKFKRSLAQRILTSEEFVQYEQHRIPHQFLAGRFAAKEAFIKAYNALPYPAFSAIEIRLGEHGKPYIFFNETVYQLSLSHDGDYVVAFVII